MRYPSGIAKHAMERGSMFDIEEILAELGFEDWEGDMDVLVCPHGHTIEHDGRCPEGCVSPLRQLGMI